MIINEHIDEWAIEDSKEMASLFGYKPHEIYIMWRTYSESRDASWLSTETMETSRVEDILAGLYKELVAKFDVHKEDVPFLAIGNDELGELLGSELECPRCGQLHKVLKSGSLSFCECGGESYLCGVDGHYIG